MVGELLLYLIFAYAMTTIGTAMSAGYLYVPSQGFAQGGLTLPRLFLVALPGWIVTGFKH